MTATKTNLTQIWTATCEWLEIAERQGFEVDWNAEPVQGAEYDAACELAGLDPDDLENGAALDVCGSVVSLAEDEMVDPSEMTPEWVSLYNRAKAVQGV